jgi:nucleoside-diphosphate-sugar epimerase
MYSNQLEIYGLRFGTVNGYSPKMRWDLIINSMYKSAMESGVINVVNPNIHRAILFIDDLVDAMQAIIDKNDGNGGIYNIASFNDSIGNIAEYVSSYIDKSTKIITSFQPSVYDFCVSCSKFNNNIKPILFNRTPEQTTELIIKSIANEY